MRIRWVQVSQKAFSPCCSLLQLSIFNLSCTLPIGLSSKRRCLIGRSARGAIQALFSSLSSTTVLQCSEDCSSPMVETFYKSNHSFPLNPHTDTGGQREFYHTRGAVLQARQQLELSPRTFSSLSLYMCMVSILHTHSLPLCVSPSLSLALHTQHVHTQRCKKKIEKTLQLIMCSSMLICGVVTQWAQRWGQASWTARQEYHHSRPHVQRNHTNNK